MRTRRVSDTDVALLRAVARERSVVAASRSVGISRDRATYRIAQLARTFGGPVVAGVRGGRGHGGSRLTRLGDRIVRGGFGTVELVAGRPVAPPSPSNLLKGTYRAGPAPSLDLGEGRRWRVAFPGEEGERVQVLLDPEAILLAPARFPSSARIVERGTVAAVRAARGPRGAVVTLRVGRHRLRAAVTAEAIRQLRLAPGARTWLYVKATALRRIGPPAPIGRGQR